MVLTQVYGYQAMHKPYKVVYCIRKSPTVGKLLKMLLYVGRNNKCCKAAIFMRNVPKDSRIILGCFLVCTFDWPLVCIPKLGIREESQKLQTSTSWEKDVTIDASNDDNVSTTAICWCLSRSVDIRSYVSCIVPFRSVWHVSFNDRFRVGRFYFSLSRV